MASAGVNTGERIVAKVVREAEAPQSTEGAAGNLVGRLPRDELPERPRHWQRLLVPWAKREKALFGLIDSILRKLLALEGVSSPEGLSKEARLTAIREAQEEEETIYERAKKTTRKSDMISNYEGEIDAAKKRVRQSGQHEPSSKEEPMVSPGDVIARAMRVHSEWSRSLFTSALAHFGRVGPLWSPYLPKPGGIDWGTKEPEYGGAIAREEETSRTSRDPAKSEHKEDEGEQSRKERERRKAKKVQSFVLSCLKPFKEASLVSEAQHAEALKKCVEKVLRRHEGEEASAFLKRDGDKIRHLVSEQVKRVRDKSGEL